MPLVPMNYNPGFSGSRLGPVPSNPPAPPTFGEQVSGTLDTTAKALDTLEAFNPVTAPTWIGSHLKELGAGFEVNNDVVNAWELMTRPAFKPDPTFDVMANLKKDGFWEPYRDKFVGVRSQPEYDFLKGKIAKENANRQILADAGPAGIVAGMAAGMVDPTMLLPFIGEGKGVFAIIKSIALGGVAGGLSEVPRQLNQVTSKPEDFGWSIGSGAILGGILGGAAVLVRRGAGETVGTALTRIGDSMATSPGEQAISIPDHIAALEAESASLGDFPVGNTQRTSAVRIGGEVFSHGSHIDSIDQAAIKYGIDSPELHAYNADPEPHTGMLVNGKDFMSFSEMDEAVLKTKARQLEIEKELEGLHTSQMIDEHLAQSLGKGAGVGADYLEKNAGALKGMLHVGEVFNRFAGPVTSNLGQRLSKTGQWMTANLSTAGLRLEGNLALDSHGAIIGGIPSNDNGTIESIVHSRYGDALDVLTHGQDNFADYFFGHGAGQGPARNYRASVMALKPGGSKMTRSAFYDEVGKAMFNGDQHSIPEVAATAQAHRKYYNMLLDEAIKAGIISQDHIDLFKDISFLNRIYDTEAIMRNPNKFMSIISKHMQEQLQGDLTKMVDSHRVVQARDTARLADYNLGPGEAKAEREALSERLKALDSSLDEELGPIEDQIKLYRQGALARSKQINELNRQLAGRVPNRPELTARLDKLTTERDDFRSGVAELQVSGGDDLAARAAERAHIKSRMRDLNRNQFMMEDKYRQKFNTIEDLEQANIDTMQRAMRAGHTALNAIDNVSEKSAASVERASKAVDGVVEHWVNLGNRIEVLKERAATLVPGVENPDDAQLARLLNLQDKQASTLDRLQNAQEHLRSVQNIDRVEGGVDEARGAVREAMDATAEKLSELNNRRAVRASKLEADSAKFDQKAFETRRAELVAKMKAREEKLFERADRLGAKDTRGAIATGVGDFKDAADEIAASTKNKVLGTNIRLPGFDALGSERGTELARTLSVPSNALIPDGFLDTNAERALNAYHHTLVPDIEITKRFGAFAPDGSVNENFKMLHEEEDRISKAHEANMRAEAAKTGKPVNEEQLKKDLAGVRKEFKIIQDNLLTIMMRIRGQYGIPRDPAAFAERAVNLVNAWQSMRLLGNVVVRSIPDLLRPVAKYGLNRTMMNAWVPMINNWKAIKMTADELKHANVATEVQTAFRAHQMTEMFSDTRGSRTGVEKAATWGASKIGIVAGFSIWTDAMKTLSSMSLTSKLMDNLERVMNLTDRTSYTSKDAVEFLNSLGWSDDMKGRIWKQMNEGGAEKIKGVWVPQTAAWTDKEAVRAFRGALYHEASASIVTPGVELPKVFGSSATARLLLNLKSFGMASTSKTLMAGLQQHDMAVLNGVWLSIALGGLSVYITAQLAGATGIARLNAMTPQQWFNEALDASGLMGAIGLATQFASDATAGAATGDTPPQQLLKGVRNAVGAYNVSRPGDAMINDVFGPTAGLTSTLSQAIASGHWTPGEIHRIRQLLILNNVAYLRWLFDKGENAVGGNRP